MLKLQYILILDRKKMKFIMKNLNNFRAINYTFLKIMIQADLNPLNTFQLVIEVDLL